MSSVCVLTPVIVGAWPAVAAAVASVAVSMGMSIVLPEELHGFDTTRERKKVITEVPNSDVLAEELGINEKISMVQGDTLIEISREAEGSIRVCVTGETLSKSELAKLGDQVAGRIVQQFAYHRLMEELKNRNYTIVEESVERDNSIQVRVRMGS